LGEVRADLAIMTGHVAQIIRDDEVWSATLAAIREALGPGGRLAFESRNPLARPWTAWTPRVSCRRVDDEVAGPVEVWFQNPKVDGNLVRYEIHYLFARSGEESVSHTELRFRTQAQLSDRYRMPASRLRAFSGTGMAVQPRQQAASGSSSQPLRRTSENCVKRKSNFRERSF
jgi:hypothetical protein